MLTFNISATLRKWCLEYVILLFIRSYYCDIWSPISSYDVCCPQCCLQCVSSFIHHHSSPFIHSFIHSFIIHQSLLCILQCDDGEKYGFVVEWYDPTACLIRRYTLTFYTWDNSVDMVNFNYCQINKYINIIII